MSSSPFKVGIIGLQPGRSWSSRAHVPALRALPGLLELYGVANTSLASAEAAAAAAGVPHAFADPAALIASPDIDIVAVTMRVPAHFAVVKAAIGAGKHVYCEWPLGNGLAEAEEMARLARAKGVLGVIGTQAVVAPEIVHMRRLVAEGLIGEVLSTTLVATGGAVQGSGTVPDEKTYGYLLDRTNGATLLTIPVGHALAAVRSVLGEVDKVSAVLATRRTSAVALDTGRHLPVSAPDQVLVSGVLASGAALSIHYRGGVARDPRGLLWEINGTKGDIRVTAPSGHLQMVPLSLSLARSEGARFEPLEVPPADLDGCDGLILPGGESTTQLQFLQEEGLREAILKFAEQGGAIFGTCAGAILLATEVKNPKQDSLKLLDMTVLRNAYGRQVASDVVSGPTKLKKGLLEMVFIRGPIIQCAGPGVEVLAEYAGKPALVQCGKIMAATFHPELTDDATVHEHFLQLASAGIPQELGSVKP